jgi:23S rRNA pseudouridine1911/1915/1917 synthase
MKIEVLFEDKNIIAINKPAGISVHGDGRMKEKTIVDWLLVYYPQVKNVGDKSELGIKNLSDDDEELGIKNLSNDKAEEEFRINRPGIVHRLDRETSGVLLIAKNQKTFSFLKEQFQSHKIKKIYRAFVYGHVSDPKASLATGKRGVINVPIGRSPKDIRAYTAGRGARPPLREAITEYIILNKFSNIDSSTTSLLAKSGQNQDNKFSYLEIYPKTGRTHQIRVHMRFINHPVVSDPLYRGNRDLVLGMERLALHAHSITFHLPNGEIKTIEAPLSADFKKVIKKYLD